jgi:hypothetical protein
MIRRIISLVGILCISTLLFTDANAKGKPDKPGKPDKTVAESIIFSGDLVGAAVVEGCCPNAGPSPEYTMRLKKLCGDLGAGTYDGKLYTSAWNAGGNPTAMVEFWVQKGGKFKGGEGFYLIGGDDILWVRKTKYLTVTFTNVECYNHYNQIGDDPADPPTKNGTASFVLKKYPYPAD